MPRNWDGLNVLREFKNDSNVLRFLKTVRLYIHIYNINKLQMPPPKQPYLTSITDHITHTTKPRKTHESACEEFIEIGRAGRTSGRPSNREEHGPEGSARDAHRSQCVQESVLPKQGHENRTKTGQKITQGHNQNPKGFVGQDWYDSVRKRYKFARGAPKQPRALIPRFHTVQRFTGFSGFSGFTHDP